MSSPMPAKETTTTTVSQETTMEELQKVFDQFDANKDGRISVAELGNVLTSMGSNYTEEELKRVMEDVDTDKDGFISFSEFTSLCRASTDAAAADSELHDAFNLYDEDKNGLISSVELHRVLNRLGMACSVDDCSKMIKSVDSDGDGNVNFEEFQKMMSVSKPGNENGSKP